MRRSGLIIAIVVGVLVFRACVLDKHGKVCVRGRFLHKSNRDGYVAPVFVCDKWEER